MKTRFAILTLGFMLSSFSAFSADTLPIITLSPSSQIVSTGATVVLSVTALGSNLQYKWLYNGDVVLDAMTSSLTISNMAVEDCGIYTACVFNSAGVVMSLPAIVGIPTPALPFANNFASRGVINSAAGTGGGDSTGATAEVGEPKPCNGRVGKSVWITWVAPTNGTALFNTIGSAFDTVLGIYTGTNLTSLAKVDDDDDTADLHASYVAFNAKAGKAYQVYVGSLDKDGGSIFLSWKMLPATYPWPTNVIQLTNITTLPGSAVTLSVQYSTPAPLTVQWYHNGVAIPGATNQTSLGWSQLTEADLGVYKVSLSSPDWTWFLKPAEIQFNSQSISPAGARNKLFDTSY